MKTTTKIISIFVLSAAIFTTTAFAGDMPNGSLVGRSDTGTTITKTEKKVPFGFEDNFAAFFRNFFGSIFG